MLSETILNVCKPVGMTSYDVVRLIKKKTGMGKVGHAGTLDPFARGVLVVLVGKATKYFDIIVRMEKAYTGRMLLGQETDTGDPTGKIVQVSGGNEKPLAEEEIKSVFSSYRGDIYQSPHPYSAAKFRGKKLYEYARKGEMVIKPPRPIKIYSFEITGYSHPFIDFILKCSSGTYVRGLAQEAGRRLGRYATLVELTREAVGKFKLCDSIGYDEISGMTADEFHNWRGMCGKEMCFHDGVF